MFLSKSMNVLIGEPRTEQRWPKLSSCTGNSPKLIQPSLLSVVHRTCRSLMSHSTTYISRSDRQWGLIGRRRTIHRWLNSKRISHPLYLIGFQSPPVGGSYSASDLQDPDTPLKRTEAVRRSAISDLNLRNPHYDSNMVLSAGEEG